MENTSLLQRIIQQIQQLFSSKKTVVAPVVEPVRLDESTFYSALAMAKKHLKAYQALGGRVPLRSLEIAQNDFPIIPVAISLMGGTEMFILTSKTIRSEHLQVLLSLFKQAQLQGRLKDYIIPSSERWEMLLELIEDEEQWSIETLLEKLNIQYILPAEIDEIRSSSIDLIYSSHYLERLDVKNISSTLLAAKKWVKKDRGIISHTVSLIDPRARNNTTLNDYDFLQYTDAQWQKMAAQHPHNRLRIYDYKKIYKNVDLYLNYDHAEKGYVYDLQKISLDASFKNHPEEEVAVRSCHFISEFRMFW